MTTQTPDAPTPEQLAALDVARELAASGVPIFLARPALDDSGEWNPRDGAGGYWLPPRWQRTEPDPAVLDDWRPGMAVCAVTGGPLDLLDTDPRNGGDDSRAALEAEGLLPRVWLTASTPSDGTHDLVAHLGVHSRDNLRLGLDVKAGEDGQGRGFAFIAPTVKLSKTTGELATYGLLTGDYLNGSGSGWERTEGDRSGVALAELVRASRGTTSGASAGPEEAEEDAPAAAYADLDAEVRARVDGWTRRTVAAIRAALEAAQSWEDGQQDDYGRGWERLCADSAWKLARLALTDWCPLSFTEARKAYVDAAPTDADWTTGKVLEKWRAQKARAQREGPWPWRESFDDPGYDAEEVLADLLTDLDARELFWTATPFLRAVRDFARARRVGRWALLGCVLARIAASTPPSVVLPPIIGGVAPLNLFVALCSDSGGGKTVATAAADDFLSGTAGGLKYPFLESVPGSGEGLTAAYARTASVLLLSDEVQALEKLSQRNGTTLLPTLKTAWAGQRLGSLNATAERSRSVAPHSYRLALVAGVQSLNAGTILDDGQGGFPQRWLWMPTYDEKLPKRGEVVPEAQPFQWTPAVPPVELEESDDGDVNIRIPDRIVLKVPDIARGAILEAHEARNRPIGAAATGHALDGHRLQSQERVAALLALAEGRGDGFTEEDWNRAGVVLEVSDETRAAIETERNKARGEANRARGKAEGERAAAAGEAEATVLTRKAGQWLAGLLQKAPDGLPWREVTQGAAKRYRPHLEDALAALEASGQALVEKTENNGQCGRHVRWTGKAAA